MGEAGQYTGLPTLDHAADWLDTNFRKPECRRRCFVLASGPKKKRPQDLGGSLGAAVEASLGRSQPPWGHTQGGECNVVAIAATTPKD